MNNDARPNSAASGALNVPTHAEADPDQGFCYFTSQQLAELTGVSHRWILRLCREGLVPHHRVGNRVRFTSSDLDAIAEHGVGQPEARRLGRRRFPR